jgi:DNA-binding LytR/AlgR family response regulator
MKKINVRFEQDLSLEHIEVLVRASERDGDTEAVMARVSETPPEPLTVTDPDGLLRVIARDDVVSVSVTGKQAQIVTEEGRYTVRQSLQSLESELDPDRFLRVSRHELVNMDKVERYDFTVNGTLRLELAGGMETWASRRCIPAIRRRLIGKE